VNIERIAKILYTEFFYGVKVKKLSDRPLASRPPKNGGAKWEPYLFYR